MTATIAFWVAALGVILSAVLSVLHHALRTLSRARFEHLAEAASPKAHTRALKILEDRPGHAASIALPRVAMNIIIAIAVLSWVKEVRDQPNSVGFTIGDAVIAALIATPTLWLFGIVLPMSIAAHAGERMVLVFSPIVRLAYLSTSPLRRAMEILDEAVRRLAGASEQNGNEAIGAELLSVVEASEAEGQLDETERDMIEGVVGFRTTTVERIMTPRTEIEAIELTDDLDAVLNFVQEIGHSRIPVYRENLDDIVGVLYAKDLLAWFGTSKPGQPFALSEVVREAMFVPEQKTVRELLTELVSKKVHLAMVADEYGGTSGLVTIEDIIEEVFGEIKDEYDSEEDDEPSAEVDIAHQSALADAGLRIDDLNDELEPIGICIPESDEYDTLGGYVVTHLGRIPEAGETISLESTLLTVIESSPTRVLRVRLEAVDEAPEAELDTKPAADSA